MIFKLKRSAILASIASISLIAFLGSPSLANTTSTKYRVVDCTLQGAVHYVELVSIPGEAQVQAFINAIESKSYADKITSAGLNISRIWPGAGGTGACVLYSTTGDAKTTAVQAKLLRDGNAWVQIHRYPAKTLRLSATNQ